MSSDESRVAELRALVPAHLTPYYDTHYNLLRWIQAHPGVSIDKIADRLRHHLLFRACSWDIDSIHEKERGYHPLHEFWPSSKCGLSGVLPNRLIHVEQCGHIDFEGILDNFSIAEMLKARLFDAEEMLGDVMEVEKATGQQASIIYITDADGMKYSKKLFDFVMNSLRGLSEAITDHYVELVSSIIVVNTPSWANRLWMMVKPLLPERTRTKVRFLSSSNWREEIRSVMDPAMGPSFWNNEHHQEFKLNIQRPPRVSRNKITESPETLEKLHVRAGKEHWLEYNLEKGDALKFHLTGNANFGFAIVREENDQNNNVLAMRQIYPHFAFVPGPYTAPIDDTVTVSETGVYKIWLSNARAWWTTLAIHHSITVVKSHSK